jgi:hypothetical protein
MMGSDLMADATGCNASGQKHQTKNLNEEPQ